MAWIAKKKGSLSTPMDLLPYSIFFEVIAYGVWSTPIGEEENPIGKRYFRKGMKSISYGKTKKHLGKETTGQQFPRFQWIWSQIKWDLRRTP